MTRPRPEVLNRIRACLKLASAASNTTDHEKSTAKAMAEKLIKEYQVTSKELGVVNSDDLRTYFSDGLDSAAAILKSKGIRPSRGWGSMGEK